ncbi:MAG TPA: YggT family protein [Gammaproteobacteria bacterium]|nr:YggT family protein [Gammaproteobacteria bacterium]
MGYYFSNAASFLLSTLFGLYLLAILLRFLLQVVRADFYNPVSQFLVKVTNPLLKPLRRVIPGWGGIDIASLVLLVLVMLVQLFVLRALGDGYFGIPIPNAPGLFLFAVVQLLALTLTVYFWTILIQVLLSWVSPGGYNPVVYLLYQLNGPLLRPAQRLIPPIGGLDLSPIAVVIALQLVKILVISPLLAFSLRLG